MTQPNSKVKVKWYVWVVLGVVLTVLWAPVVFSMINTAVQGKELFESVNNTPSDAERIKSDLEKLSVTNESGP